ncbi:7-cyano-7-deazaguanine synthase [Marinobacter sp. HL-58]|uniref:7-cyano-7-deazaguanine synthase n=1 Tax=Marinobacter sp. HL-58 TaxID=1479237 RepID=UPI00047F5A54|nr:7-cyano-7-deazaguanine synthase [Marinobacter sp. HL-58]KPQ01353.1 MAG: Queuosine biosynthesis protein QueC [Marinobacter sp. HL-58]
MNKTVDVLWTGGWDSTFRVIQLLFQGIDVKPHYICDPGRASSPLEISAMNRISDSLKRNPELKGALLPLTIVEFSDFTKYNDIEKAYIDLMREHYIGEQYKWIADYCRHANLESIDISVQNNPFIRRNHSRTDYPFSVIFKGLNFPLINYSKNDMKKWCIDNGFLSIIEESWFCHSPTRSGKPCGVCSPCIVVSEEGMGYRLPTSAIIRYHLRVLPRVKSFLKNYPKFYARLYRLKSK